MPKRLGYPSSVKRKDHLMYPQQSHTRMLNALEMKYGVEINNDVGYLAITTKKGNETVFFAQGEDVQQLEKDSSSDGQPTHRQILEYLESAGAISK